MWGKQTQLQGNELIEVSKRLYDDDPKITSVRREHKKRDENCCTVKEVGGKMKAAKFNEFMGCDSRA